MSNSYPVEERFGEIVASENWGIVPYALYKYQRILDLGISDIWFVTWLFMHAWTEEDVYPSLNAMSRYTGKTRSYIQRIARRLERKSLIVIRERRHESNARMSNYYDIGPLTKKLEDLILDDPFSKRNKK